MKPVSFRGLAALAGLMLSAAATVRADDALDALRRQAREGDPASIVEYAKAALKSRETLKDNLPEVRTLLQKAADAGNADALVLLGRTFTDDRLVPGRKPDKEDYARGFALMRKAAGLGNAQAMRVTGLLCVNGIGTAKDTAEGVQWLQKAAERGDKAAIQWLIDHADAAAAAAGTPAGPAAVPAASPAPSSSAAAPAGGSASVPASGGAPAAGYVRSIEPAAALEPVGGVQPIALPPPMDLSKVSAEQWAGVVTQAKEGMAVLYGDLPPSERKKFDDQWAPFFEFPAPEVMDYFARLAPLVAEFVLVKESCDRTAVACDQAQFELLAAISGDDREAVVSLSLRLRQIKGLFASQTARLQQLAAAVAALGPLPDVTALKAKAKKRHGDALKRLAEDDRPETLEGTWEGEGLADWTFEILHRPGKGLLLVEAGVLEPVDIAPNAWIFIQGDKEDKPEDCRFWRLDLLDGLLRTRAYEPSGSDRGYDVGTFKTYYSRKIKPLTRRRTYRPEDDTDEKGKPFNWVKWTGDRMQAQREVVEVLRTGSLPRGKETSRRREWAAAHAEGEVEDVIQRMALEENKRDDKVEREKAQGRAFERMMGAQFYWYGDDPPGFENLKDYDRPAPPPAAATDLRLLPDVKARERRQGLLVSNLLRRLELHVKLEQDYVLRLHDMTPEQRSNDVEVLKQAVARTEKAIQGLHEEAEKRIAEYREWEAKDIADLQRRERESIEGLERELKANLASYKKSLADVQAMPPKERDKRRFLIQEYTERIAALPSEYAKDMDAVRARIAQQAVDRRAETQEHITRVEQDLEKTVADKQEEISDDRKALGRIGSKVVRRTNNQGGYEEVSISLVLAEAKKRAEDEFDMPGYVRGVVRRMDEELPLTAGKMGLTLGGAGAGAIELPSSLMNVGRMSAPEGAAAAPPPPPPGPSPAQVAAAEAARKAAEQEAQAKKEKIETFQEEIAALQKSLEGLRKTENEIAADDKDRARKLEGLARDRLVLEANVKAAEDQVRYLQTGVYERTRTAWDDFNRQVMIEDGRATAAYWENVNRKLDRMNRLIEAAPAGERDALRRRWNDQVDAAIAAGAKFDRLDAAAREIGDLVGEANRKEGKAAEAEAAIAERNLYIAEKVKTVADYSITGLTMYATAGLSSPVSLIMPTCAESALSAGYSVATGYIEGGPVEAIKQAATGYSQAGALFNTAMESYQRGVLNHLEEYARNPQKAKLDETGAGLSSMAWALGQEGAKMALMQFVVTPTLAKIKASLNPPKTPKPGGGIFGPEEIRFKTAAELKEERLFRDKDLYGKHLMQQFKQAHEALQEAKTAGKSGADLEPFRAKAESAYKAANSDFHAKNWMKRVAKNNEAVADTWCRIDAEQKGRLIEETKALLRARGLSDAEMRCYSNSASKGSVGMDMDLGFVEPSRWIQVPDDRHPGKTMAVVNPEYWAWRRSLTQIDPATGAPRPIHPREYARAAHEAMTEAYQTVYGHPPEQAFLEFTFRDHPEAYKDMAWLGRQGDKNGPPWADFCNVNPAWTGQAADVTGFKVNRMQKPGAAGGHDELPSLPRYSAMLEQCRGLLKDFDTKLIGGKADTGAFGNEAGAKIRINPESPLGKAPAPVQKHFLDIREVLNDFAGGRITPSQAERKLNVLTGGQGIVEVPEQLRVVMSKFKADAKNR